MTEELYTIKPDKVIVPKDRVRKEFDPKELRKLADSIRKRKQDTPGICLHNEKGEVILVAGERRLRACALSDAPFTYRLEKSTDEYVILEIEVEENLHRVNLNWQEEVDAMARLQEVKQHIHGAASQGKAGWGERQTAEFTGKSLGGVHEDLELSLYANALPEMVGKAKTKTEAKKIVKRLKEDLKRSKALEKAKEAAELSDNDKDMSDIEKQMILYDKNVHCGLMEEVLPSLKETFDIVIFDPPWGVEYDEVKEKNPSQEDYEDELEYMQKNLPSWLSLLYEKMKEDSHLYLFFGIVNIEFIYTELEKAGFETNRMPLIWYKQGMHRTRNPEVWPGRSYEPIAYARKGKKQLVKYGAPDVIVTPAPTPSMKKTHPSAKHPLIYLDLLQRSASPGDSILDPMCGSGMLGPAAEVLRTTHQLKWTEIDSSKNFCNLAVDNAVKGCYQIYQTEEEENNA